MRTPRIVTGIANDDKVQTGQIEPYGRAGQGIAWDRSGKPTIWGIGREGRKVVQMSVPLPPGRPKPQQVGAVYGPGQFVETGE